MGDCRQSGSQCLSTTLSCPANGQDCSVGLSAGDTLSIQDLVYGLLLDSGNDAAIALAEVVAGTEQDFVDLMNARARQLGLNNTSSANLHGRDPQTVDPDNCPKVDFDDENCAHYSSARDLALLAQVALAEPIFANVVATPTYQTQSWSCSGR